MEKLSIYTIPALRDNYSYVIRDNATGATAALDVPEHDPIIKFLESHSFNLDYILSTHHHWDHTDGNIQLKKYTNAQIVGNGNRIPSLDIQVSDQFVLGQSIADIIKLPGHTYDHIAFLFNNEHFFCGDALFIGGCGRIFDGSIKDMCSSLNFIKKLRDDTLVYCGHNYTLKNLRFALEVDPSNQFIKDILYKLSDNPRITVPSSIKIEKLINPFLRLHDEKIKQNLAIPQNSSEEHTFKILRQMRNSFQN